MVAIHRGNAHVYQLLFGNIRPREALEIENNFLKSAPGSSRHFVIGQGVQTAARKPRHMSLEYEVDRVLHSAFVLLSALQVNSGLLDLSEPLVVFRILA